MTDRTPPTAAPAGDVTPSPENTGNIGLNDQQIERALDAYSLDLQTSPLNTEEMRHKTNWPDIFRALRLSAMREAILAALSASPAPKSGEVG